jgi:hypothetical protein
MKIPICQGSGVLHPRREMRLSSETDKFWSFTCGCGCIRAVSKPSVRAEAIYNKEQQAIERIRQAQQPPRAYSFARN